MGVADESMLDSSIETHLRVDIFPHILIKPKSLELVDGDVEHNRHALWKVLKPSLDKLIDKFELPRQKPEEMTDAQYFKFLATKMYDQNSSVKLQDKELVKWSAWPSVTNETGATNCSLGAQVLLKLLEMSGYEVEFGTPGPLSHAVAFAKSGKDYYYIDPANGIVEKVTETLEVDGIKVHMINTDNFRCPFEAVPAFPIEYCVVTTVSNLQGLQNENDKPSSSDFAAALAKKFNMVKGHPYRHWATHNLFPQWETLTKSAFWQEETARVDRKINS